MFTLDLISVLDGISINTTLAGTVLSSRTQYETKLFTGDHSKSAICCILIAFFSNNVND